MQSFELIDLILFLGISQGIFLAITIQIIQNKNKAANKILSIILLLSVLMLLGRMVFYKFMTPRLFQWTIFADAVIFIFGPLCYTYFRRLAFSKDNFKLSWFHYLPVTFHLLFFCYTISFSPEEYMNKLSSGDFKISFKIIEVAGIFSNMYYWIENIKLLKLYIKEEKNTISYKQNLVSFLFFFQISICVFLAAWTVNFITMNFFNYSIKFISYDIVWGTISVFIFVVGYYSLKEPELFRIPFQKREKSNIQQRMSQNDVGFLEEKLLYVMEEEKIFLKPNLTLRDLSERLHTSTHNISWYLNKVSKSNFYDYINRYRIKEFLMRIENNEHLSHTILAISLEVGFNSKSTFNKAFKLEMKDTPRNYIKRLKVA